MPNKEWWETAEVVYELHNTDDYIESIVEMEGYSSWFYAIVVAQHNTRHLVCLWASADKLKFEDE